MSLNERVAALLEAHADQWVDGQRIAAVGGYAAWRSRISDLRRPPYNLVIENRTRRVHGHKAHCQMWDFSTSECHCGGGTITVSEYRLVKNKAVAA